MCAGRRRNLAVLSRNRNLDYHNSDRLVISETMASKGVSPEVNTSLYADIEPYNTGFLKVSDIHTVYYEESGNPDGHVSFCYLSTSCVPVLCRSCYKICVSIECTWMSYV